MAQSLSKEFKSIKEKCVDDIVDELIL